MAVPAVPPYHQSDRPGAQQAVDLPQVLVLTNTPSPQPYNRRSQGLKRQQGDSQEDLLGDNQRNIQRDIQEYNLRDNLRNNKEDSQEDLLGDNQKDIQGFNQRDNLRNDEEDDQRDSQKVTLGYNKGENQRDNQEVRQKENNYRDNLRNSQVDNLRNNQVDNLRNNQVDNLRNSQVDNLRESLVDNLREFQESIDWDVEDSSQEAIQEAEALWLLASKIRQAKGQETEIRRQPPSRLPTSSTRLKQLAVSGSGVGFGQVVTAEAESSEDQAGSPAYLLGRRKSAIFTREHPSLITRLGEANPAAAPSAGQSASRLTSSITKPFLVSTVTTTAAATTTTIPRLSDPLSQRKKENDDKKQEEQVLFNR